MSNKKQVKLMRGQSGSGKSTYVKKHFPSAINCSADSYFIDDHGEYRFNPKKLGQAHGTCQRQYEEALKKSKPLVVVDNTNTTLRELQFYIQLANVYGYEVEVIRVETPVDVSAKRNTHGVPEEAVKRMRDRMVDYPGETIVSGES